MYFFQIIASLCTKIKVSGDTFADCTGTYHLSQEIAESTPDYPVYKLVQRGELHSTYDFFLKYPFWNYFSLKIKLDVEDIMQENVQNVPKAMELVGAMVIANGLRNNASITKVSNSFLIIFVEGQIIWKGIISCQHFSDRAPFRFCKSISLPKWLIFAFIFGIAILKYDL